MVATDQHNSQLILGNDHTSHAMVAISRIPEAIIVSVVALIVAYDCNVQ